MSGLFLHHSLLGMAILVNANHVSARQRFSYAHEYAHALFDANRTITVSDSDNAGDLVEVRANAFASAFLMPEQGIANLLRLMGKGEGSRVDLAIYDASTESAIEVQYRQTATSQKISAQAIAWIAHHFGVSYQATVYRLQNLGYFKAIERDCLLKEEFKGREYLRILRLVQEVEIPTEPASQNRELKAQITYLAIEAFQRGEISRGRLLDLSKLLELSGKELLQLAESGKVPEYMIDIIVSDTSVLINFLKIDRLDLLGNCSLHFLVTDHVKAEINDNFPDQLQRFQNGLQQRILEEINVAEPAEIELFANLLQKGKLGIGECSAISVAIHRKYSLAIDDNLAIKSALSLAPHLHILRTQDLMVKMIQEGIMNILDADTMLRDWEENHRFKLKINTFKELLK